jgi:hypothetical protein
VSKRSLGRVSRRGGVLSSPSLLEEAGLAVVVADAMMLDTVLGLGVRGDDARATPGAPRVGREGGGAWMEPACARAAGGGGSWWYLLVRGAPLASYGLVAHFPSCSRLLLLLLPR